LFGSRLGNSARRFGETLHTMTARWESSALGGCNYARILSGALEIGRLYVVPILAKVGPCWIGGLDERDFFGACPTLQFLFTLDRKVRIAEVFKPDEAVAVVSSGEAVVFLPFVLEDSLAKVASDADV